MTQPGTPQPAERAPLGEGTDIVVDPQDLIDEESAGTPASSDPEQMNEDEALGGVGGGQPGGAG
jgi:hypothetical protein